MYMLQPAHCVSNVQKFSHALWFSVHTAATIGYGHQAPNPDCVTLNSIIMVQVMTAALMQAALLGAVYARFSSPNSRAATIKFSSILTCHRGRDGLRRLAFRVANLRRHQLLQPEVRMLLMRREQIGGDDGPLEYRYHELSLTHVSGHSKLWLGVPSIMAHTIDTNSPLWGITREELEQAGPEIEFVVLLDGVDESTSMVMQARHSYFASDIRWGESFAGVLARRPSGALAADYSHFDLTRLEAEDLGEHVDVAPVHGGAEKQDLEGGGISAHEVPVVTGAHADLDAQSSQSQKSQIKMLKWARGRFI